jgi:DNA-directed RNA polymerase specialized sigma24 family protein
MDETVGIITLLLASHAADNDNHAALTSWKFRV